MLPASVLYSSLAFVTDCACTSDYLNVEFADSSGNPCYAVSTARNRHN